jgi:rhodanese-related sulfurtransferase
MTVVELATRLGAGEAVRVLDVRTPAEFEHGHLAGAYNVPLDQLHEHARELRGATGAVVLVCQSGQRARQAETLLRAAGMASMHVLDGGMKAWVLAGNAVRQVRPRVSIERQVRMVAGAIVAVSSLAALAVSPLFAWLAVLVGSGLVFAGATDTCTMGLLLARLPYNRGAASCDTESIVRQFLAHESSSS